MRRVTVSIKDCDYEALRSRTDDDGGSFSATITKLAMIGINHRTNNDLASKIISDFDKHEIRTSIVGNFFIPKSVLQRAIKSSLDFNLINDPILEYREIVGLNATDVLSVTGGKNG